ncbi:MAG: 50S ribosomal protein L3 [Bdellovibrionales bacterium RBG_16_40_8]|nr:MAG: 50S ribosomal protein L3 [Bdellovibrionales bacterium RBG_16_40_8]
MSEEKLQSLYAFKMGMTTYYDDRGESISATILKYEPMVVSQLKSKEKDGYVAVQVAFAPKRAKRTLASERNHLKAAGFENGSYYVREVRQNIPEGMNVGSKIDLASFQVGDKVKATALSKGRGFAGVVKRWKVAGGPESHGSGFHRHPGSIGNRTWPGRVMPGKKFPGHMGNETVTVKNVRVLDIIADENVIVVGGPIPGSKNTLVKLTKV